MVRNFDELAVVFDVAYLFYLTGCCRKGVLWIACRIIFSHWARVNDPNGGK